MIISPCSAKHKISNFPLVPFMPFLNTITKLFKEYRVYPPVQEQAHPKASFSFERCLYITVLEWKFQAEKLHPKTGFIKEYFEVLLQNTTGIEQIQQESQIPLKQNQAKQIIQRLRESLEKSNGQADLSQIVWSITRLDYVLVLLIRKIIKFGSIHSAYSKSGTMSVCQKLQPSNEAVRRVSQAFRQAFIMYVATPDFKQPQFQNAIYLGLCNNQIYSFYTFSSRPQIQLKEQKTIRLDETKLAIPSSIYLSSQVISEYCAICNNMAAVDKSLHWNYKLYCQQCILSPKVELNMIPQHKIQAYIKENKLPTGCVFVCPNCQKRLQMNEFNPANKPLFYQCSQCRSSICIKHDTYTNICFCHCGKCLIPTFIDQRIKLKICLKCKQIRCQNCGDNKCVCRCPKCYELVSGEHRCQRERECHQCMNVMKNMLQCSCGGFMCKACCSGWINKDGLLRCPRSNT